MRKKDISRLKKGCLVLDIETSAQYPEGDVIDINTNFEDYVKFAKIKWLGMYSYLLDEYVELNVNAANQELIKEYIDQHRTIVGFNNEEFDIPIMYNNDLMPEKRFLQVDCLVILGASTYQRHDGLPFKDRGKLMGYKFKKNSLKMMAEAMELDTQKGDIDYQIFLRNTWSTEETVEIIKYLKGDIKVTKEMFDKLWDFWMPFTEFIDDGNIKRLTWIRSSVASLTYQAACYKMGVECTYGEKSENPPEEMGGNVIDPKYEEATQVWYLDFTSLYPNIDAMFNLFAEMTPNNLEMETVGPMGNGGGEKNIWHGNDLFQVKGYYDISEQHILSKDVVEKIKLRLKLKKEDPTNPLIYTLKIFLNSLYGVLRSPIFEQVHTPNAGWDTCWLGQQIQKYTEERMKQFGFETIAGDTDSIFVKLNDKSKVPHVTTENRFEDEKWYVKDCLATIVKEIKTNVPFPAETFDIDIEHYLEYVMWPFSLQAVVGADGKNLKNDKGRLVKELKGKKKNYLYLYDKNGELTLKIMGLPVIKDNATKLGKQILDETLKPMILKTRQAKFTKSEMKNIMGEWLTKPEAVKGLAREFKVKPFAVYKKESQIQAQISRGYFGDQAGVISLIKNKIVGRAGKTAKYCTYEEAKENKLTMDDLDLTKLKNELEVFIKNE